MSSLPKILKAGYFNSHNWFPETMTESPPRTVTCYELEYYTNEGGISTVNGIPYTRHCGTILVSRPGDVRNSVLPFQTHYLYLSDIDGPAREIFHSLPPLVQSSDPNRDYKTFTEIRRLFLSSDPADELEASSLLLALLSNLSHAGLPSAEAGPSDAEAIYTAAKRIIDSRFAEPLTIKDIADECHVSVSYLHRVFAKAAGRSPHLTLIERRIIEAQILLADTSLPVGEIAARCGFYSQSHFNECFKKKTGNTPNEFRRSNRYTI